MPFNDWFLINFSERTENNSVNDFINHKFWHKQSLSSFLFIYLCSDMVKFILWDQLVKSTNFSYQIKIKYFDHSAQLN